MLVIVSEDRVSRTRLRMLDWREFSLRQYTLARTGFSQDMHFSYTVFVSNDYTETVPDIILCPSKDARL